MTFPAFPRRECDGDDCVAVCDGDRSADRLNDPGDYENRQIWRDGPGQGPRGIKHRSGDEHTFPAQGVRQVKAYRVLDARFPARFTRFPRQLQRTVHRLSHSHQVGRDEQEADARVHRLCHRFGQRLRLFGADDDHVHAGADKLFDVCALFEGVVLGVLEHHSYLGVLLRRFPDIGVHLDAPRLAEVALAHAEGVLDAAHLLRHQICPTRRRFFTRSGAAAWLADSVSFFL